MLFNSYLFLFLFLPVVLLGWWQIRHSGARLAFMTLASYVFYGAWNWRFIPLMIASTTVDCLAGARIAGSSDPRTRKAWLAGSLTFNLAILGFFKYFDFFASSVNSTASIMGAHALIPVLRIVLPIGISFYTFNSMSYTIDIYRGVVRPAKSLLHFSAFVALFPHLVAGPIVRYSDIEQQFADLPRRLRWSEAGEGVFFFVAGMAKKIFIADNLAEYIVKPYFSHAHGQPLVAAWLGVLGYTFQIYFDFSAYSDMAVGLAHLLGIQFPQNFNSPYQACNISDFWRRWHISLSTWLRDYLYIPLGGSRGGQAMAARNLAITMFLGGLWHGANWTFIVWGLYHGLLLAGYQLLRGRGLVPQSAAIGRALTFLAVVLGWVFFRADSMHAAASIFASMAGLHGLGLSMATTPSGMGLACLLVAAGIAFFSRNTWEMRLRPSLPSGVALACTLTLAILYLEKESPFLYFQF